MKVILIEPRRIVARDAEFCLKVRWQDVDALFTSEGRKGLDFIETQTPDLVMVGTDLADMDTVELITNVRSFSDVPLIVITQQPNEMDKVRFLEAGADDCIDTPFSPIEFVTKIKALLRRACGGSLSLGKQQSTTIGDKVTIDPGTREVRVADRPVMLTPTEFRLLLELVKSRGRVVSNEILLERVWGADYVDDVGFIKRYVYRLRQKLEVDNDRPLIISARGIGYRLIQILIPIILAFPYLLSTMSSVPIDMTSLVV